jgi:hypothetical protein
MRQREREREREPIAELGIYLKECKSDFNEGICTPIFFLIEHINIFIQIFYLLYKPESQ